MDEQKKFNKNISELRLRDTIIGSTVSIDSVPHDKFVSYLEKVDFSYLKGFKNEERQKLFGDIFGSLKSFRLGLYLVGVDIGYKRIQWLSSLGFISAHMKSASAKKHLNIIQEKYVNKFYVNSSGEMVGVLDRSDEGDKRIVLDYDSNITGDINADDLVLMEHVSGRAKRPQVTCEDWKIDDVFDLPPDLVEFIDTINKGWQVFEHTTGWHRFNKYREQAYSWLKNDYKFDNSWSREKKIEFLKEERVRCLQNSLYKCNKYLWLIDSDDKIKGELKFTAWKSQEAVLFLIDLGLSLIIGKLRQIGLTSVIGGSEGLTTSLSKNYYCKLVAQKGTKSEEIFRDKVKYPITKLAEHMKVTIPNWNTSEVIFGYSPGKGAEQSSSSKFDVVAPAEDAINGGTPSKVLLDEIGFMKMFGAIVSQGRPTMFKFDPILRKMKMTKQLIAWGTGGSTGGTGSPMETEWKAAKEAFAERNFNYGLIPLFLNFYAKPGHTDDYWLMQKEFYYKKKKLPGEDDPKIVFHQSFPITEDDMFLQSSDTVVPIPVINMQIKRINTLIAEEKLKVTRGYFEPVYNTEKPRGEDAYVPYTIIGARFVPADESLVSLDSEFACITIYERPDYKWENRYYKGTDPIITSSGHSKFASTIKDKKTKKTVAKLNFKSSDYRFEYLQSLLLNLYYSKEYGGRRIGIPECLEMNVGGEYYNFVNELGYSSMFMGNAMLPENLRTSTMSVGISKKGHNAVAIVNRLEEMLIEQSGGIDSIEFWVQMKTFVKKETKTGFTYEPDNKKIHWDDEIDSEVYSKICTDCHQHRPLRYIEDNTAIYGNKGKRVYYYDQNWQLRIGTRQQAERAKAI